VVCFSGPWVYFSCCFGCLLGFRVALVLFCIPVVYLGASYASFLNKTLITYQKKKSCNVRDNLVGGRSDGMKSDKISLKTRRVVVQYGEVFRLGQLEMCVSLRCLMKQCVWCGE